jgi:hypothetical protein
MKKEKLIEAQIKLASKQVMFRRFFIPAKGFAG